MTEQPEDEVWSESVLEVDDAFFAPSTLALTAFVLAVTSVSGFGFLNGFAYVALAVGGGVNGAGNGLAAGLVGAVLALIPVGLGLRAHGRLLPEDASWVGPLARAAVLLGLLSLLLRLVGTTLLAAQDAGPGFTRF